jgi:hypothetical protein
MRFCSSGSLRHGRNLCRACGMASLLFFAIADTALAQSPDEHGTVPNLSGFYRHNTSAYSPPAQGGPGPVGDLPGYTHGGADPWVGDHLNPILKEHTAAEVKRLSELELAGGVNLAAFQLCKQLGVPLILTQRENIQLLQTPDQVTIIYQRDHHIRKVYLNVPHSKNPEPSWYGESVGHYEGDTLVVDTIGQKAESRVDRYGSFGSEDLHVVERYHLAEGGDVMQVDFTVTDPNNFTTPWNATQYYQHSNTPWEEVVCAENNRDAQTGVEYEGVPIANKADF